MKIILLLDIVFIGIGEAMVLYLITNSLLNNILKVKQIIKISLMYAMSCYIIRTIIPLGINVMILFLLFVLLYYRESKTRFKSILIAFGISSAVKFASEFVMVIILYLLKQDVEYLLNNQIIKIIMGNISVLITFLIYLFIKKKQITMPESVNINITKVTIFNIFLMATITLLVGGSYFTFESKFIVLVISLIIVSVLCIGYLILTSLTLNKNKEIFQLENNLIRTNLDQIQETVDALRIQKHDYMNHLQVILLQVSRGNCQDARQYILGICDEVENDNITFDTGCNYIDAILNIKSSKCKKYKIELSSCVDSILKNTPLQETELSSIFLNIIDNAIDELKQCEKEYKYIHIDTYIEDSMNVISISNNGRKISNTEKIFNKGYSSKGNGRGYGLYSIKQMLQKKNCSINVYSDDEETSFIIELPIVNESLLNISTIK